MKWVEPIKEYLTEQEVSKLLSAPYPNKMFKRGVEFSLNTGLRHSDILALKHSHIKYQGDGNVILSKDRYDSCVLCLNDYVLGI